jgi:hypothetical protein
MFSSFHTALTRSIVLFGDSDIHFYLAPWSAGLWVATEKKNHCSIEDNTNYNNNPPHSVSFMPAIASTSGRLHSEFVRLLFLQAHRETDRFFAGSGVQLPQSTSGLFHFRGAAFTQQVKNRVDLDLTKAAVLRITLNLDGAPITSKSHTHPSLSQTSRLLTSSLSLGVPVPRSTQ